MTTIAREWRGRVPRERADAYLAVLEATGLKNYARTPGHRGTLVLRDDRESETEYALITFWESADAIRAFAGDDIGRAVYYPEDDGYLIEKPERLRHYSVANDGGGHRGAGWPPIVNWR